MKISDDEYCVERMITTKATYNVYAEIYDINLVTFYLLVYALYLT